MTATRIDDKALEQLFTQARTHNGWLDKEVPDSLLRDAMQIAIWGPTSANCLPMRVIFVRSPEAKARLAPALSESNRAKTLAAPAVAIIGYDLQFYELLPRLYPATDARSWFAGNDKLIHDTAVRNGTLQGAYFLLALRAVGLDTGPMSGFDNAKVDAEFFPEGQFKSNVLINIGYGDVSKLFGRSPRFSFDQIANIV
jgi:3-hydroxypropanoate dehydrogenase